MAQKRESWSFVGRSTIEHSPTPTIPTLPILTLRRNVVFRVCKHYYSRPRIVLHDETYFYSVYARNPVARLTPWDKGNYWMRRGEGGRGISVQGIYKRKVRVKSNQWQSRWRCRRFTCVICKWQGGGRFHYETGGVPVYGGTCDNAPRWGRCVIRSAIRAVCGKIFPTR